MVVFKYCTAFLILFLQLAPVNADVNLTDYCSDNLLQTDYTGTINHTITGKTCQSWNVNFPHDSGYAKWYGDRNYCRNTKNPTGPWCLTTKRWKRWELCNIPLCAEVHYCPEELKSLTNAPRNCQYTCHCRDKCKLDSVNGTCQFGCDPGWTGPKCQTDINKCTNPSVCHHGTCSNTQGSYHCTCNPGYTGLNCQHDINEFTILSICHSGTCINTQCNYHCTCNRGFAGPNCRHGTAPSVCHHGTCSNTQGRYNCNCNQGYIGSNCLLDINECTNPSLCHNGTCNNTQGSYHCNCNQGYTGSNCQHDVDECGNSAACSRHGSCINSPGSYHCTCDPGYTESNCGEDINECTNPSLCHNGTCNNTQGSYHCNCNQGYTGSNCQHDVDECGNTQACNHHGSCINSPGSYHCTCESGYTGSNCGEDVTCSTTIFTSPLRVNSTTDTTSTDKPYATNLSISCDSGYQLLGKPLTACQNNGTWSNVPSCTVTATYCTLTHKHNCQNEANCSCQYLCHCVEADSCDPDNGTCGRGDCSPGWMGKSCQYANIAFSQTTSLENRKLTDGKRETCVMQIKNVSLYLNEVYPVSALQIITQKDLNYSMHLNVKSDTNRSSNYSNIYCFNDMVEEHKRHIKVYCTHVLRSSQLFITFSEKTTVCEIEVYGGRNVALWQITSQYGVYTETERTYNSNLAVDGKTSTDFTSGTCSHTKTIVNNEEPWWMINLESITVVTRVKLFIRSPDHATRMSNFSVSINNDTKVIYHQHENPPPGVIDIVEPFPLTINNLKVTIPTGYDRFVSLCEVQIFACIPTNNGGENCSDFCPLNCYDNDFCVNDIFQCSTCKENWGGPFCRYRQCESITSGNLNYTNNIFTEENLTQTTLFSCSRGYNPGIASADCDRRGRWFPRTPECTPVECNALNKTTHLQILGDSAWNMYVFQDEVSFGCSQGYSLQGNQTLRCLYDGNWNASVPDCIRIQTSTESSSQTALIGGGLGGVVAVLSAVVVVLVIVLRRRRVRKGNDESAAEMDDMPSSNVYPNITKNDIGKIRKGLDNTDNDGSDSNIGGGVYQNVNNSRKDKSNQFNNRSKAKGATYEVVDKIKPKSPTAVLVTDFKEMLENSKLKKDHFALEFQRFLSGLQFPYEKAIELPNRAKNKYRNIYPYDKARVVLSPVSGKPDSDYINASYINGNKETRCFIAAQGPIDQTINDFWRMMWQLNAGKIVMLTNLVELGKTKCRQYWPEDKDLQFPGLTVKLLDTEVFADFRIRTMTLSDGKTSRTVKQFHFTAWPDKGTPTYSSSLVHFASKVRHTPGDGNGPLVVHCSAGIGRTGTFIALEILIKQAAEDGFVDVFECVASLRQQRLNMVQTLEQYIFLHHTLLEALMSPSHEISAGKFPSVYAELLETEENSSMRKLDLQFQTLNETSPVIPESEFITGKQSTNKAKNRYSNIIPVDSQIPKLEEIQGEEDNYINAVFLPGYKRERNFLLTQMPLSNTITDFWRLVHDYSVSTIVMLNDQPQDELYSNSADMGVYWPLGNATCSYGPFRIENIVEESDTEGDFSVIQLKYLYRNIESRDVTLFQARFWKESEPTPSSPTSLLRFIEATETHHEKQNTGPMIVHCMNGSYKSGLFCVAKAVIENLKLDQDVRIHHVIKQMRSCRPQIIPNVEQFKFCYDLVLEFMDQFDAYSNFK